MTGKQFKISVVIPVYNVELYVAETIESVIRQDIGFEENVQIVLVNDGSPDGSGQICEEYAKRYPEKYSICVSGKCRGQCGKKYRNGLYKGEVR